jgi:ectoine hydroxylase-related dioxygenase (phytanoyl-CoA dioxygenase family)
MHIDLTRIQREMDQFGFSVLKNVIDIQMINLIHSRSDKYYEADHKRFGSEFLKEINELEIVRNVFEYDSIFIDFLESHEIFDLLAEKLLHKYAIIHNFNLIRLLPDFKTKMLGHEWHRDVFYFGPGIRTAINIFIPLEKTNQDNGATKVLPGSHLYKELPPIEDIDIYQKSVNLEVGDILIGDAATYHRAGNNQSKKARTILSLKYTLSFFTQQYNFCKMLPVDQYSENLRNRLGYKVRVPESLEQLRVLPNDRLYKWPIRF